jgi:hypothetical protein
MRSEQVFRRRRLAPALGVVLGIVAGVSAATWSAAVAGPASNEPQAILDATHLPPLLTVGEPLDLAYEAHCAAGDPESADEGCDVRGSVFVRGVGEQTFAPRPLVSRSAGGVRQLAAEVPDHLAGNGRGIEYYAVLDAPEIGKRLTLPAGGAAAPHVSRPLGDPVIIDLGRHAFGSDRRAGTRVASAAWGERPGEVGLERGRNLPPIGASSFDVDARGDVVLLDQVHRRLLRWSKGETTPEQVPVSVEGTLADIAVDGDGSLFVLESTAPPGRNPLVKRFDEGGRELEAIESAERTPSQIRIDERGPVVLGRPSHHWVPLIVDGVPASADEQLTRGRAGRRFDGGREVVVYRHANEVRVAIVAGGKVVRSWRLRSATSLAEVQLAEPSGNNVVLVVRAYADDADEFAVFVLGRNGIVDRFSVDSADWAETAPLARFRLVGRSLYRLGSSPTGVFVDRFDLEVR